MFDSSIFIIVAGIVLAVIAGIIFHYIINNH